MNSKAGKKLNKKLEQFIKALKSFDQDSKGLYVLEHLLLRPMHLGGYKLLLNASDEAVACDSFESIGHAPLEELKGVAESLLVFASNARNYDVLPDGNGFFIVIKHNNQPILVSSKSYDTHQNANTAYKQVLAQIQKSLKSAPSLINDWIDFNHEEAKGMSIDNAFYAHRISIVLPKWPAIFMEQSFQLWFKQIVAQKIPAHLRADLIWLDWEKMKSFETSYWEWMCHKSQDNHDVALLDNLSYQLVEKLEQFGQNQPPKEVEEHFTFLTKNRLAAILEKYKPYFLFKPSELHIVDGIDKTTEYWLKKEHIGTWTLLSIADPETIQKAFSKSGSTEAVNTESLKLQARLAAKGSWAELEKLQQQIDKSRGFVSGTKLQLLTDEKLKSLLGNQE